MIGEAYQVLSDCVHCRTEASVVELMDPLHPASHLGVAVEVRCRLCGWRVVADDEPFVPKMPLAAGRCPACHKPLSEDARSGQAGCPHCGYAPAVEEVHGPSDTRDPDVASKLLDRWAREEGETDTETFCQSNMGASKDEIVRLLQQGAIVGTTFDVIAFLFPGSGSGGGGGGRGASDEVEPAARPLEVVDRPPAREPVPEPENAPVMDPGVPARVLISVMVADGDLRRGERLFIDRFLAGEGMPDIRDEDLRIWRPQELPVPPRELRTTLLDAMIHLMHLDRQRDGSEWKVIVAFARYWGVSDADLEALDKRYDRRYATAMTRLWRTLSSFVRIH